MTLNMQLLRNTFTVFYTLWIKHLHIISTVNCVYLLYVSEHDVPEEARTVLLEWHAADDNNIAFQGPQNTGNCTESTALKPHGEYI